MNLLSKLGRYGAPASCDVGLNGVGSLMLSMCSKKVGFFAWGWVKAVNLVFTVSRPVVSAFGTLKDSNLDVVVSLNRGTQYRPQSLDIVTLQKGTPGFGTPHR